MHAAAPNAQKYSYDDLAANGWGNSTLPMYNLAPGVEQAMTQFEIPLAANENTVIFVDLVNSFINDRGQKKVCFLLLSSFSQYNSSNTLLTSYISSQDPKGGTYINTYNPAGGTIVALANRPPRDYGQKDDLDLYVDLDSPKPTLTADQIKDAIPPMSS